MFNNLVLITNMAFRNIFRNWGRNRLIIIILVVAVLLIEFLVAFISASGRTGKTDALDMFMGDLKYMQKDYKIDPTAQNSFLSNQNVIEKLRKEDGVYGVAERIVVPGLVRSERYARNIKIVGIDPENEKDLSLFGKVYHGDLKKAFENNGVVVGRQLVTDLETKKGFKLAILAQDKSDKSIEFPVIVQDIYTSAKTKEQTFVFMNIHDVERLFNMKGYVTGVSINLKDSDNVDKYYDKFKNEFQDKNIVLYTWEKLIPFVKTWLHMMDQNTNVFFTIVLVATVIPVVNTILISTMERMFEFGLMRAIGLKKIYVFLLILIESFLLLLMGIVLGFILSWIMVFILSKVGINLSHFSKALAIWGSSSILYPYFNYAKSIALCSKLLFLGLFITLYPAIKVIRYNPVQSLSRRS